MRLLRYWNVLDLPLAGVGVRFRALAPHQGDPGTAPVSVRACRSTMHCEWQIGDWGLCSTLDHLGPELLGYLCFDFWPSEGGKGDSPVRLRVQTRSECDLLCLFKAWTRIMSRVYHPWERRCVWSDPLVGRWARHLVRRRRLGTSRGVSQWWGRGLRLQREAFGSQGVSQCHRRGTEGWCDLFVGGLIYLLY